MDTARFELASSRTCQLCEACALPTVPSALTFYYLPLSLKVNTRLIRNFTLFAVAFKSHDRDALNVDVQLGF